MNSIAFAQQIRTNGLGVWPGFLSKSSLQALAADLSECQEAGSFARAGTGQGSGHGIHELVRRDTVHWLGRVDNTAAQSNLWVRIDALKKVLNQTLFLGLSEFDGHYASYPDGGFYRRHLDCFKGDSTRVVSLILYLCSPPPSPRGWWGGGANPTYFL